MMTFYLMCYSGPPKVETFSPTPAAIANWTKIAYDDAINKERINMLRNLWRYTKRP